MQEHGGLYAVYKLHCVYTACRENVNRSNIQDLFRENRDIPRIPQTKLGSPPNPGLTHLYAPGIEGRDGHVVGTTEMHSCPLIVPSLLHQEQQRWTHGCWAGRNVPASLATWYGHVTRFCPTGWEETTQADILVLSLEGTELAFPFVRSLSHCSDCRHSGESGSRLRATQVEKDAECLREQSNRTGSSSVPLLPARRPERERNS